MRHCDIGYAELAILIFAKVLMFGSDKLIQTEGTAMAYQHAQSHSQNDIVHGIWDAVKATFSFLGSIFTAIPEMNYRVHQVEYLQAKSDAELKTMGLRREDIARHVFHDTLYL